jgi:KDO2-lipid IV(A) lauroyltransferase
MAHYSPDLVAARTRPKHYAEYAALRTMLFFLRILPLSFVHWLARCLGTFAFDVVRIRRRVTLANLRAALGGHYIERQLVGIARSCYRNFACTFFEFALTPHKSTDDLTRFMTVTPREPIAEAAALEKGIVYLTGHTGNWELLGAVMGQIDRSVKILVGDQKNLLVDRYAKRQRAKMGMEMIEIGSSMREVMRTLKRDGRVALVADQDGGPDGIFLDFLGRPASYQVGPARFAYRTGAPIVIGLARRLGGGRHEARLYPPIIPDRSRPEEEETRRILTEYTRILEDFIRRHPDQWFWMHRRWKTRPAGEGD